MNFSTFKAQIHFMKKFSLALVAVLIIGLAACDNNSKRLSKSGFGDEWPFTVSSGNVRCVGTDFQLTFEAGGKTFALNDAARASEEYEDISSIVKADENYPGGQVKMDLSVIEFEGLKLCNHREE